eukprot:TRINITY_DN471071_c0_g2_i1.p1 TRINITY_DN471071_c0_g2~~TRINITY_DN471071_c0_g2_i1.p1  ORF type:complete len:718 (+),score=191.01 TRINITY_DN471071_c0_g2_i1:161-2314(+)
MDSEKGSTPIGKVCNRCGKSFTGKAALKRHKKKCKEPVEEIVGDSAGCPLCSKTIPKGEEASHKSRCKALSSEMEKLKLLGIRKGKYFDQIRRDSVPDSVKMEILKSMTSKEKTSNIGGGRTLLDILLEKKYSLEFLKEYFRNVPGSEMIKNNRYGTVLSSLPDVPLDVLEFVVSKIPVKNRCDIPYLEFRNEFITADMARIMLSGIRPGTDVDLQMWISIGVFTLEENHEHGEEIFTIMWQKMSKTQRMHRIHQNHRGHSILTFMIIGSVTFSLEFLKMLLEGMPKEFGYIYDHGSKKLEQIYVFDAMHPSVRRYLEDWINRPPRPYILPTEFRPMLFMNKPMAMMSLRQLVEGDRQKSRYCTMLQLCRDIDYFAGSIASIYRPMYDYERNDKEIYLLAYQEPSSQRQHLIHSIMDKDSSTDRFEVVFHATTGIYTTELPELMAKVSEGASLELQRKVVGNDPFFMDCFKTGKFPKEFFSKKKRIGVYAKVAQELKDAGDLIGAVEYYWRAVLSSVKGSIDRLQSISFRQWCLMTSKLQHSGEILAAIKCARVGLLVHPTNKEHYVLFHAMGKLFRAYKDTKASIACFQICVAENQSSLPSMFELGVSTNMMEPCDKHCGEAASLYNTCVAANPDYDLPKRALINLILGATNCEDLKKCDKYRYLFDDKIVKEPIPIEHMCPMGADKLDYEDIAKLSGYESMMEMMNPESQPKKRT